MRVTVFYILTTILCCNHLVGQEAKEIDMVITMDEKVLNTVQGISFKMEDKNGGNLSIVPQYHPGSLIFTESDYQKLMASDKSLVNLKFYQIRNKGNRESSHDYSISFHRDWLNENFIVLNIYNLDNRKYRKSRKPIEKDAKYSASVDFGHYAILDLNNQSDYKIPKYH